ncbi:MAG: AbrB/MazE/SpoVT family DNA-binding domain-containing protein [Minisyncoccota bacterium]
MAAGRRKREDENIRSLIRMSNGKSYAVTLPIAVVREFGWEKRQKLELTVDAKKKRITISDWEGK